MFEGGFSSAYQSSDTETVGADTADCRTASGAGFQFVCSEFFSDRLAEYPHVPMGSAGCAFCGCGFSSGWRDGVCPYCGTSAICMAAPPPCPYCVAGFPAAQPAGMVFDLSVSDAGWSGNCYGGFADECS